MFLAGAAALMQRRGGGGELSASWGLLRLRPGRPYLVGRHQIQVTRVHGVKLHHVVHRFPIGHCHRLPAHHLHALVQVDLGGRQGLSGDGAPGGHPQVGMALGGGCPELGSLSLRPFQDWRWVRPPRFVLCCDPLPHQEPPLPALTSTSHLVCTGPGFTVKKTFSGRLRASSQGAGTWV